MENSREKFKQIFPDTHSLIVALHPKSVAHALEGAQIAIENGAHGIAVVTHSIDPMTWFDCIEKIKERYPYHVAILNILDWESKTIFQVLGWVPKIPIPDGIWTDRAGIPGVDKNAYEYEVNDILKLQETMSRKGLYFGWVAFKHQKILSPEEYPFAVQQAKKYLDIITTSWPATGQSADVEKVKKIKSLAWNHPVGLASGITPDNIHEYLPYTDISIVATGISKDYYDLDSGLTKDFFNLDPTRVAQLAKIIEQYNRKTERKIFESDTLKKYSMSSVHELYKYLSQWDIINIGMHPEHNEVQKKLSNLSPSPFSLDGVEYASVEAFRMSIKYPPTDPRHIEIRQLSGIKAKSAGRDAKAFKSFLYQWKEIRIGSVEHHALLKRALRAKLEQNPHILQTLLDTWDKTLTHIVFTRHRVQKHILHDSKTIPGETFAQLYTELREEFRDTIR